MSQISAFGIGAGRAITGEPDEEEGRLRQRRLTAAQRAEHERRSLAMRERLAQAAREERTFSARQQMPHPSAEEEFRNLQAEGQKRTTNKVPARHDILTASAPSGHIDNQRIIDKASHPKHAQDQADDAEKQGFKPGPLSNQAASLNNHQSEASVPDATERNDAGKEQLQLLSPRKLVTKLLDDLAAMRGPQFEERLATQLEHLLSALRSHALPGPDKNEIDRILAALEFIEGYAEASDGTGATQQRLAPVFSELRQQMTGLSLNPQPSPVLTSAVLVASSASSEKSRADSASGNPRLRRPSVATQREEADHDADTEATVSTALVESSRLSSAGTARSSKSSLSKDAEKRRDETLVSVTVRSV